MPTSYLWNLRYCTWQGGFADVIKAMDLRWGDYLGGRGLVTRVL